MITPDESEAGLRAYEQVMAFDVLRRRQLPLVYITFTMIFVIMAVAASMAGMATASAACGGAALFSALFEWWNWTRLSRRDERNRAFLDELETKYGSELPWLQVERQLAALERIKLEIESGELPLPPDEN